MDTEEYVRINISLSHLMFVAIAAVFVFAVYLVIEASIRDYARDTCLAHGYPAVMVDVRWHCL